MTKSVSWSRAKRAAFQLMKPNRGQKEGAAEGGCSKSREKHLQGGNKGMFVGSTLQALFAAPTYPRIKRYDKTCNSLKYFLGPENGGPV